MEQGMTVIRKTDLSKNIPIFGTLESFTHGSKKAVVRWHTSLFFTGRNHHSTISLKSLAEATPEIQRRVDEAAHARYAQKRRKMMEERIYICMNVNPLARVSNDGHPKPLELAPGQVKDGCCWYCKAPIFKRCSVWDCCAPAASGSAYCEVVHHA